MLYANFSVVFLGEKAPFETIEALVFLDSPAEPTEKTISVSEENLLDVETSIVQLENDVVADSSVALTSEDSLNVNSDAAPNPEIAAATSSTSDSVVVSDSSSQKPPQKILLFGDSMVEGLARRLDDYAEYNGYEFISVLRFSSTTIRWAGVDNLKRLIDKEQPTFIMVALGSNELFIKDLKKAGKAIDKIMSWFGDTPFIWIGPPNWSRDTGINDLIREKVGEDRFFESRNLTFTRCSDNIHPTFGSSERWMDKVVEWMNRDSSSVTIKMEKPLKRGHRKHKSRVWKQILP